MILPQKSLGQHFLTNEHILLKIVNALQIEQNDALLEIGAGPGYLTRKLLNPSIKLNVVEIDKRFSSFLDPIKEKNSNFNVYYDDFLKMNLDPFYHINKFVGNLPYNIAMPIIERITTLLKPKLIVFMLAKGTAERLLAKPGQKEYSAGTIFAQSFYQVSLVASVSKNLFHPPPKIDSAICRMVKKKVNTPEMIAFNHFVRSLFSYRRKTLHNAIKQIGFKVPVKLSHTLRIENCSIDDLMELFHEINPA